MVKSTYKRSELTDRHERNRGRILYLIKENYGIHKNELKRLASKKGPSYMNKVTVERIIDELLNDGKIKLRKSDKSRYYILDDWYTEVQLQKEFDERVIKIGKTIEFIKNKFPAFNWEGKQGIVQTLDYVFQYLSIPPYYYHVIKTSAKEEDKCMTMIRYYSKNTTKKSVAKLVDDARFKVKEIKTLRKEIVNIKKQMENMPSSNPEIYRLLNQRSVKDTSYWKSIQMLYDILSSIKKECQVRFQNY